MLDPPSQTEAGGMRAREYGFDAAHDFAWSRGVDVGAGTVGARVVEGRRRRVVVVDSGGDGAAGVVGSLCAAGRGRRGGFAKQVCGGRPGVSLRWENGEEEHRKSCPALRPFNWGREADCQGTRWLGWGSLRSDVRDF